MDEHASFEPRAVLPPRRARRIRLAIFVPAIGFVVILWGGLSGGTRPEPAVPPVPATPFVARGPDVAVTIAPSATPQVPAVAYPETALGLQVRTLSDLESEGIGGELVLAIAGWYVAWPTLGCPASRSSDPTTVAARLGVTSDGWTFCHRTGFLMPTPAEPVPATGPPSPLRVVFTPGVPTPSQFAAADSIVTPVVLVGRIVPGGENCSGNAMCPPDFRVDRVAWAGGSRQDRTTSVLPKLLDKHRRVTTDPGGPTFEPTLGSGGDLLLATLVDQATLADVDPVAAKIVASSAPAARRIWYRLTLGDDPAHQSPHWLALDDENGEVLASGSLG